MHRRKYGATFGKAWRDKHIVPGLAQTKASMDFAKVIVTMKELFEDIRRQFGPIVDLFKHVPDMKKSDYTLAGPNG